MMICPWIEPASFKLAVTPASQKFFDRWHRKMIYDQKKRAKRQVARRSRKITRRNAK